MSAPYKEPSRPTTTPRIPIEGVVADDILLVNAEDLARRYGVAIKTIRKWGAEGLIPYVKISRRLVRYPVAAADRFVDSRRVKAIDEC